ncbi:MAG TPA: hypothetical protein VF308_06730 [Caldimonas sp.]
MRERDGHVARVEHRAHHDVEVAGIECGDDDTLELALRTGQHAADDDHESAADRFEGRRDIERVAVPRPVRDREVFALAEVAPDEHALSRRDDRAARVEQEHVGDARDRVAEDRESLRGAARALAGRACIVGADARQGLVDAVELVTEVFVDDAGLPGEPVALDRADPGVVLLQFVADQGRSDRQCQQQREPFGPVAF